MVILAAAASVIIVAAATAASILVIISGFLMNRTWWDDYVYSLALGIGSLGCLAPVRIIVTAASIPILIFGFALSL